MNDVREEARPSPEERLSTQGEQAASAKVLRQGQAWCVGGTERNREVVLGKPDGRGKCR